MALAKARAVAAVYPHAIVIGSDQVCDLQGRSLGKPGTHEKAVSAAAGHAWGNRAVSHRCSLWCASKPALKNAPSTVRVQFRNLSDAEIERYLHADQPYDCAGSAKSESLGITLLDAIHSDDPTALIGLPLIATAACCALPGCNCRERARAGCARAGTGAPVLGTSTAGFWLRAASTPDRRTAPRHAATSRAS